MSSMVSYPRRLQSGHFTCYLNRTYHVLTTRIEIVDCFPLGFLVPCRSIAWGRSHAGWKGVALQSQRLEETLLWPFAICAAPRSPTAPPPARPARAGLQPLP